MTLNRLRLSVADARDLAQGALRGIGYHNDEARIVADHVIDAARYSFATHSPESGQVADIAVCPFCAQ